VGVLMALKKGSISQTTKSQKNKLNKLKNTEIELEVEKVSTNGIKAVITMTSVMEPYVRNRLAGNFSKKNEDEGKPVRTHLYDPLNTYKSRIRKVLGDLLKEKYPDYVLCAGQIYFDVELYSVPPKDFTKRQLVWAIIKKLFRPITKPDLDNVAKTAMDVCSGLFWVDDNQVVELTVRKFYGEAPKSIITFYMDIEHIKITGRADKEEEEQWKTIKIDR
jgi:Holliday junction resolvase RusA-like endonuclease